MAPMIDVLTDLTERVRPSGRGRPMEKGAAGPADAASQWYPQLVDEASLADADGVSVADIDAQSAAGTAVGPDVVGVTIRSQCECAAGTDPGTGVATVASLRIDVRRLSEQLAADPPAQRRFAELGLSGAPPRERRGSARASAGTTEA